MGNLRKSVFGIVNRNLVLSTFCERASQKQNLCLISLYLSIQPRRPNHDLLKSHPWETNSQAALIATLKFPIAKKNLVSVTVRNLIQ